MSQPGDPVIVRLTPTRGQYAQAFMWVGGGLVISIFFIWLAVRRDEMAIGALIIGVVVLLISLASAVLEYRNLPGVVLRFWPERLTLHPHSGEVLDVALADLSRLETVHVAPVSRRRRRRDALAPGYSSRPSFGTGHSGWHLNVVLADGEPAGPVSGYPIGLDAARTEELREACGRAGVNLRLGT